MRPKYSKCGQALKIYVDFAFVHRDKDEYLVVMFITHTSSLHTLRVIYSYSGRVVRATVTYGSFFMEGFYFRSDLVESGMNKSSIQHLDCIL